MPLRPFFLALLGLGWTLAVAGGGAAAAADLASYKASYTVKTATIRKGSPFVAVTGAMTYATEKACDGWVTHQEMTLSMAAVDGSVVQQDFSLSSWESFDGGRYRFVVRSRVDDEEETFRGRALLSGPAGGGEAIYSEPENHTFPLPANTLFPMRQTAMIIDRAGKERGHVPHVTFDGTDGGGVHEAVVYIGQRIEALPEVADPLLARPGWLVRLSYYSPDEPALAPEYEVEALQLDNGLAPRLILDYQDFSAQMILEKLEPLPEPHC
ncbi:MAG: cell envelope integrity EipB family protein [Magnetospirillum sp. WYHS-4]